MEKKFQKKEKQMNEKNEKIRCSKCDKTFGNDQILKLHLQVHEFGEQSSLDKEVPDNSINKRKSNNAKVESQDNLASSLARPSKNRVGLTKVRLEDCLRCDECSCIYMDHKDYIKHMRNFHKEGRKKRPGRIKRRCRSCCDQCKCLGDCDLTLSLFGSNPFQYNIKNRWSKMMVLKDKSSSKQKEKKHEPEKITDDEERFADLLASVEVRIKTEPPDEPEICESG